MLTPIAVLTGLIGLLVVSAWVSAILDEPERIARAPHVVRTITRTIYWHTRTHWQMSPACAEYDNELLYKPRPGTCDFNNIEFDTSLHFDASGARTTSAPSPSLKSASLPRIVILGDSHAMGWGVEDDETFASVLASQYGYSTINLAVSSYATPRELRRLERDFDVKPNDVILIQYCDNDLRENQHFLKTESVGPYELAQLQELQSYRPTPAEPLSIAALVVRLLWREVVGWLPGGKSAGRSSFDDALPGGSAAHTFLGVLNHFQAFTRNRIIVVAINGPGLGTHLSQGSQQFEHAGITMLVPNLGPDEFYAIDDHMRPRGHALVAEQIANILRDPFPSR